MQWIAMIKKIVNRLSGEESRKLKEKIIYLSEENERFKKEISELKGLVELWQSLNESKKKTIDFFSGSLRRRVEAESTGEHGCEGKCGKCQKGAKRPK